jgi:hypothetical protein
MTARELIAELAGTTCRCGKLKSPRQTFCRICYFRLAKEMRDALYNGLGQGYEEAYARATDYLDHPVVRR